MASTKSPALSETEIELKRRGRRRLIGAATIGLLGIVFLPMIFDGEPRRSPAGSTLKKQEISVQIPAKEGQPALPTPSASTAPTAPAVQASVEPVKPATVEAAKPAPQTATVIEKTEPAAKPTAVAETPKKGFAVQLGVFADADNAKLTIAKMNDAKLPVYSESIPIKSGTATRVRIGPFASREKAEAALVQIKLAGSDGKIIPLQ